MINFILPILVNTFNKKWIKCYKLIQIFSEFSIIDFKIKNITRDKQGHF